MSTTLPVDTLPTAHRRRNWIIWLCSICLASLTSVSARVVSGLVSPGLATAFVSSPSAGADAPVRLAWGTEDTGLRVACFNVANTSVPRPDRTAWPRVTAVGFELPGTLSGFSIVAPLDGDWELAEDTRAFLPGHGKVTLDFALVARTNPKWRRPGRHGELPGIPPGQPAARGSGTRFCVSGPFPDEVIAGEATTIEQIINGVVVGFHGADGNRHGIDVGVWDNAARIIPLYPQRRSAAFPGGRLTCLLLSESRCDLIR